MFSRFSSPTPQGLVARFVATAFTFCLLPAIIFADEPDAGNNDGANKSESAIELVVTASRIEEAPSEAAVLVQTITKDDIESSGATSVVEALEDSLGVSFRSYSGDAQAEVSMRGFGENSSGRVLVLLDGRRLNNPDMSSLNWLSIPLESIERIEVLHGSASVLYGGGAVGGVINIITARPKDGFHGYAAAGIGTKLDNEESAGASWGGDGWYLGADIHRSDIQGWRDRSESDSLQARLAGGVDLGGSMRLAAFGFYNRGSYQMPGSLTREHFLANPQQAINLADEARFQGLEGGISFDWAASSAMNLALPLDASINWVETDNASLFTPSYNDTTRFRLETRPQINLVLFEDQLPLRAVAGADASYAGIGVKAYAEPARTSLSNNFDISQWAVGPFVSLRVEPLETLAFDAGFRYDVSGITGTNSDGTANGSKLRSAPVWSIGSLWQPLEDLRLFASYATTFRYPCTDEQTSYYGYGSDNFLTELEPETGRDLRVGAGWKHKEILSVEVQGYWLEMEDEIAWNAVSSQNENIGNTRRLGLDTLVETKPLSFLSARINYSFVNAIFVGGVDDGKQVPLVSAQRINGDISITLPFGLSFGPTASWQSAMWSGGDNSNSNTTDRVPAVFLLGAQANYPLDIGTGTLDLSVTGENLLNTLYAPYVVWGGYYPAPGCSLRLSGRYRF